MMAKFFLLLLLTNFADVSPMMENPVAPSDEVVARINCGGFENVTDTSAQTWEDDKYATAGIPYRYRWSSVLEFLKKLDTDSLILKSYRWSPRFWSGSAEIKYEIPLTKGGVYAVEFLFPDHYFSIWDFIFSFSNILKSRLYNVYIEDALILEDIEIKSNAMSPKNTMRVNTKGIKAIDGILSVRIVSSTKSPSIAGIVVYDVTPRPDAADVPTVASGTNAPTDSHLKAPSAAPNEELAPVLPTFGSVLEALLSSSSSPSSKPSSIPTSFQPSSPSETPSSKPSSIPASLPSSSLSVMPSSKPSSFPSSLPSSFPSKMPSSEPSSIPTSLQSSSLSEIPRSKPSSIPSSLPSSSPSEMPSSEPSSIPTSSASSSAEPSSSEPSAVPTNRLEPSSPSSSPSAIPSSNPSPIPTSLPSSSPSEMPSSNPSSGAPIFNSYTMTPVTPLPTVSPTWAGSPTPCHFESKKLSSTYDGHRIFLDEFGKAVAVHGNTVVVGAPRGNNNNGADSGSIYVYTLDSANGHVTLQDKFTGTDTKQDEWFGSWLAIHGDTIVAGRMSRYGRESTVYIFVRENETWIEQAKLTIGTGSLSLDIHADTVIIGSWRWGYSGFVRVFVRDVSQQWSLQATLQAKDAAVNDSFGSSVGIHGNTAIVGAPYDDDNGPTSGSVYIFVRDENGVWTQDAKLLKSGGSAGEYFGSEVAIDMETIVVGAKRDDQRGTNSGSAFVYRLVPSGGWVEEAKLMAYDAGSGDYFASAVAIDGDMIAVGVALDDDNAHSTGSAYLFKRNEADEWSQQLKFLASDGESHDKFGQALGVSNGTVVVGAYWNVATNEERTGAAYVYSPAAEPTLCQVSTSTTVSIAPTFMVSDAPFSSPMTPRPSPLGVSDFPVSPPCDYGCYDIEEDIYIAYSAPNSAEPTPAEYNQMESLTLDFFRSYLALVVNGGTIDITFRSWQYEARIPEDKFNIYLELSSFAGQCGCAHDLNEFQVSRDVLGVYMEDYQTLYVTSLTGSPFQSTGEIVLGEWYK